MANCRVRSADINFEFETVLPKLKDLEEKTNRFQNQWKEFQSHIIDHEAGHIAIYRRLVKQIPQAMRRIRNVRCEALDQTVQASVDSIVKKVKQANSRYDNS